MRTSFSASLPGILLRGLALLVFLVAASVFTPSPSTARDTVSIDATGAAAVVSGDVAGARDAAISDALRKAVEEAVGAIVSSDTATENFQVINDRVYTRSQGFVKGYEIISEARTLELVEVKVRADVATGDLKDDLAAMGLIQKRAGAPRVLFMVAERGPGAAAFDYWWSRGGGALRISATEAALKEAFLARGFRVADVTGSIEGGVPEAFRTAEIPVEGARAVGRSLNAEVVVYGRSVLEEGPSTGTTSVATYMADVSLQAVRVDDGELLASAGGRATTRRIASTSGETEAFGRAASVAAEGLARGIVQKWTGPHIVNIKLEGMDYKDVVEFKRLLRGSARAVEAVYLRRFEGGVAYLEVESGEGAQSMADAISRLAGYRVTGASSDTIEVEGAE